MSHPPHDHAPLLPYGCYTPSSLPPPPALPSALGTLLLDLRGAPCNHQIQALVLDCQTLTATPKEEKRTRKALSKAVSSRCAALVRAAADPAACLVHVYLPADTMAATDGLLAASFLDVGCAKIVLDVSASDLAPLDLAPLDACRLPPSRVVAALPFSSLPSLPPAALLPLAAELLVELPAADPPAPGALRALVPPSFLLTALAPPSASAALLSSYLSACLPSSPSVRLCLPSPSPALLAGLWVSCARTDRPDGLFATVVTTRAGVALGLV